MCISINIQKQVYITLATAHRLGVRTFGMGGDEESQDEEIYVELQIQAAHEVLIEVAGGTYIEIYLRSCIVSH